MDTPMDTPLDAGAIERRQGELRERIPIRFHGPKKAIKFGGVENLMTLLAITGLETGYKSMNRVIVGREEFGMPAFV